MALSSISSSILRLIILSEAGFLKRLFTHWKICLMTKSASIYLNENWSGVMVGVEFIIRVTVELKSKIEVR